MSNIKEKLRHGKQGIILINFLESVPGELGQSFIKLLRRILELQSKSCLEKRSNQKIWTNFFPRLSIFLVRNVCSKLTIRELNSCAE